MKQLSIVIPIYNVEPYIRKCLESLVDQNISKEDYELICVNDGSPDNSREIVLDLKEKYTNILLIEQENQGVSHARNRGIELATGKYILLIDPDDYVERNSLGQILDIAVSSQAKISIPGYTFIDENGKILGKRIYSEYSNSVLTGIEAFHVTHKKGELIADSSVGILFETEFLSKNKLKNLPDVPLNQDCEFLARVHCLADRCVFVDQYFYVAVARKGSASRSNIFNTEKVRNGFLLSAKNLLKFKQQGGLNESQKSFLNGPIIQFVFLALFSTASTRSISNIKRIIDKLKHSGLGKLNTEGWRGYYRVCGKIYNISPYLGTVFLVIYLKTESLYDFYIKKRKPF